jgi:small subunit ribosomal protein S4
MYEEASRQPGITGENLLRNLELRLDNVVFRAGWGASRSQARQFVRHGHVQVNGRRVTIPSYRVRTGDKVTLRESTRGNFQVRRNMDTLERQTPAWLAPGDAGFSVDVLNPPQREHIDEPVQEQLIVELYSK